MKAFVMLGGLLLLLVGWIWMCSGQEPVSVECTHLNFRAVVKRALFYEHELVGPDELFLGTGCQAIYVRPDELEFDYPVSLCGIKLQAFFDRSIFHSWLIYIPRNRLVSAELHLECVVPSPFVSPDESQKDSDTPPPQYWFLRHYRYCSTCGSAHFRDNWEAHHVLCAHMSLPF